MGGAGGWGNRHQVQARVRHHGARNPATRCPARRRRRFTGRVTIMLGKLRILIADDHTLVRAGLVTLMARMQDMEVVGEAGDGREALKLVRDLQPDIALMDIAMPGLNGLEAAERIHNEAPKTKVIILSMHANEEY